MYPCNGTRFANVPQECPSRCLAQVHVQRSNIRLVLIVAPVDGEDGVARLLGNAGQKRCPAAELYDQRSVTGHATSPGMWYAVRTHLSP